MFAWVWLEWFIIGELSPVSRFPDTIIMSTTPPPLPHSSRNVRPMHSVRLRSLKLILLDHPSEVCFGPQNGCYDTKASQLHVSSFWSPWLATAHPSIQLPRVNWHHESSKSVLPLYVHTVILCTSWSPQSPHLPPHTWEASRNLTGTDCLHISCWPHPPRERLPFADRVTTKEKIHCSLT